MNGLLRLLAILAGGYLLLVLLMYLFQERLLFLPHLPGRELGVSPADIGLEYESVTLRAEDGVQLHGWHLPVPEAAPTVLFFHGNAGNISHRLDSLEIFHRLGLNVFIIDYRGYGESDGRPSEQGLYRDADAALAWLREEQEVPAECVVAFGRSLGAAVAAYTAAEHEVGALMLESAFLSVPALGAELYPWLPVRTLSRMDFDVAHWLQRSTVPVLVVHSPEDEIAPFAHGQRLREIAGQRGRMLEIRGDHNTGFLRSRTRYMEGLTAFLEEELRCIL